MAKAVVLVDNKTDIFRNVLSGFIAIIEGDLFDDQLITIKQDFQVFSKAPTLNNHVAMLSQRIIFMKDNLTYVMETDNRGILTSVKQLTENGEEIQL